MGKKKVSIVTVSQYKRRECLEILKELIQEQTYDRIIEWVIVDGSESADREKYEKFILGMRDDFAIKIVYVKLENNRREIGYLRNQGNKYCKGDIIVCMDDDDYYFPTRVEHAVNELNRSNKKIAGCSSIILYDYLLDRSYLFKPFHQNHSTNACFAYKKEFNGVYDDTKICSEEPSFTKNFSIPMVQLDSYNVMVVNSHNQNTFNKRELLTAASIGINPNCTELKKKITDLIPAKYLDRYKKIFLNPKKCEYDIEFFMGGFFETFQPDGKSLPGMVQSVVSLSSEFVLKKKKVAVYGPFEINTTYKGVDYINWKEFPFRDEHNTVIMWRSNGYLSMIPFEFSVSNLYLDLHDGVINNDFLNWFDPKRIDKFFFKGPHHRSILEHQMGNKKFPDEKIKVIGNAVQGDIFVPDESIERLPFRFCYTTCYTKALIPIIENIWPRIFKAEPRAELHVYGGYSHIGDVKLRAKIEEVLRSPGVMDHGRQEIDLVVEEKRRSSFYLFLTRYSTEIDSISIKECYKTGCIPILSNQIIYNELPGFHFDFDEASEEKCKMVSEQIIEMMRDYRMVEKKRKDLMDIYVKNWHEISDEWINNL